LEDKVWTILDVVNWTTEYFELKGIESARLNIELMICQVLGISRVDIYTNFDKPLSYSEREILRNMIIKRNERMPLQYILGNTNFLGYEFFVNDSVMIPRPETEQMVKLILDDVKDKAYYLDILDIGTGSGCIALSLAKKLIFSQVLAIDNSYFALFTAKNNSSHLRVKNIIFNECDILNEIPTTKKFDIIVSNPPYIPINEYEKLEPEVKIYEPRTALTDEKDGMIFYKRFSEIIPDLLKKNGKFYFEFGFGQKDEISKIFNEIGFRTEFFDDFNKIPRIIKGWKN
jgi:release factor glutamine methyltransferase